MLYYILETYYLSAPEKPRAPLNKAVPANMNAGAYPATPISQNVGTINTPFTKNAPPKVYKKCKVSNKPANVGEYYEGDSSPNQNADSDNYEHGSNSNRPYRVDSHLNSNRDMSAAVNLLTSDMQLLIMQKMHYNEVQQLNKTTEALNNEIKDLKNTITQQSEELHQYRYAEARLKSAVRLLQE